MFQFTCTALMQDASPERVGRALWRRLLERAGPGGDLGQPGHYVSGSAVHRSRVRAWQALAVLSKFAPADDVQTTFRTIWSSLQVRWATSAPKECLFLRVKPPTSDSPGTRYGRSPLLICPQVDNNASVRQYQEAILVGLLLKHPELVEEYLLPVLAAYEHR